MWCHDSPLGLHATLAQDCLSLPWSTCRYENLDPINSKCYIYINVSSRAQKNIDCWYSNCESPQSKF